MGARKFSAAQVKDAAPLFAALGDPTRLELLARLSARGPGSTQTLSEHASVTRQAVSKHLRVLADADLVEGERHGRERIWKLLPGRLVDAQTYLERIDAQWDAALERLADLVDGPDEDH